MSPPPSRHRLLWLVPKWPLPMQDGARVATVNLLKGLSSLGVTIDLVAVAGRDERCDIEEIRGAAGVSDCFVIRKSPITRPWRLWRPWLPVTLAPFADHRIRRGISRVLGDGSRWSGLVYDGLHSAAHASRIGVYARPPGIPRVIYRAHNVESEIWRRRAERTWFLPFRVFLGFQAFLMKRFEDSLAREADTILPVSEIDLGIFRAAHPGLRGQAVPIGYDFSAAAPVLGVIAPVRKSAKRPLFRLLFLGRLDWPPNREGLLWFLEKVWPEARRRRPSLELWIAGSGDSEGLRRRMGDSGAGFLGRVERVEEIYRDSLLSLVPVFYGSGTRVKAIEASRYGRACLSTAIGVEGLGLEDGKTFLQAETAPQWIEALARLDRAHAIEVGQRAHELLKSSFHLPVAARKFLESI